MQRRVAHAQWHAHVNNVHASAGMRHWLTDTLSLTVKLIARCEAFRVQRLVQGRAAALTDEYQKAMLSRAIMVQQREVLLRCDEKPVVYAHTIVPLTATAADWPFFSSLGDRSLGTTLFGDPRVQRGALEYARLYAEHPLAIRAAEAVQIELRDPLFARRCLYARGKGLLLVTEIFLPAIELIRHTPFPG